MWFFKGTSHIIGGNDGERRGDETGTGVTGRAVLLNAYFVVLFAKEKRCSWTKQIRHCNSEAMINKEKASWACAILPVPGFQGFPLGGRESGACVLGVGGN